MNLTSLTVLGTLTLALSSFAFAGELDNSPGAPQSIVVRIDSVGTREVFKADTATQVTTNADAADVATHFAKDENRLDKVVASSELDRVSSKEAWYYWYSPSYIGSYYYSYWSGGSSWSYYPSYSWYYSSYTYYYYYRF